jgi:hypothetical protein
MRIGIALFIWIMIFSVPLDKWNAAPEQKKENAVRMMIQDFKADNPSCVKAHVRSFQTGETFNVIIECLEKGYEI